MSGVRVPRREFVLGGAAAAGAVLCTGPLRAMARLDGMDTIATMAVCPGSEAWSGLSADHLEAALRDGVMFTAGAPTGEKIGGAASVLLAGGWLDAQRGGTLARVRVEFARADNPGAPRLVDAMGIAAGETPGGVRMQVPVGEGAIGLRVSITGADEKETEHRLRLPAKPGVYAAVIGAPASSWRVRWSAGRVETDAACCVLIAVDRKTAATGPK
jgi:hypothetical protein